MLLCSLAGVVGWVLAAWPCPATEQGAPKSPALSSPWPTGSCVKGPTLTVCLQTFPGCFQCITLIMKNLRRFDTSD